LTLIRLICLTENKQADMLDIHKLAEQLNSYKEVTVDESAVWA